MKPCSLINSFFTIIKFYIIIYIASSYQYILHNNPIFFESIVTPTISPSLQSPVLHHRQLCSAPCTKSCLIYIFFPTLRTFLHTHLSISVYSFSTLSTELHSFYYCSTIRAELIYLRFFVL